MFKHLYFLVEGNDDERFFKNVIKPLLINKYEQIKIWQHAQKSTETQKRFLKSLEAMGADYIYVVDIDNLASVNEKKNKITTRLEELNPGKILVVIKEIEGWYLAGIDKKGSAKIGLKYISETNELYKEDFNQLMPKHFDSRIDFMQELIKSFSIETGKAKNDSLNYFFRKFIEPVMYSKARDQIAATFE